MGGNSSKVTSSIVSDMIISNITKTVMSCTTIINSSQDITIKGDSNKISNIKQSKNIKVNMTCLNKTMSSKEYSDKITGDMINAMKQQSVAIASILDNNSTSVKNSLKNLINITNEKMSKSDLKFLSTSSSKLLIEGNNNFISNISQNDITEGIASLVNSDSDIQNIISDISSQLNSNTSSESKNPLEVFSDILGKVTTPMMVIIAVIVIFIGSVILLIIYKI